jgi:hypothetical protein
MNFDQPILTNGKGEKSFSTGAVRDNSSGKGRCDLLPMDALFNLLADSDSFMITRGDQPLSGLFCFGAGQDILDLQVAALVLLAEIEEHLDPAIHVQDYSLENFPNAILEVSKHFEKGAERYAARNWEKGIPLSRYLDSAIRHYLKHTAGEVDEPHLVAATWNVLCLIQTQYWINAGVLPETLNDLPIYQADRDLESDSVRSESAAFKAYKAKAEAVYGGCLGHPFVDENTLSSDCPVEFPVNPTVFPSDSKLYTVPTPDLAPAPAVVGGPQLPQQDVSMVVLESGLYRIDSCFALVVDNKVIDQCKCSTVPICHDVVVRNLHHATFSPITGRRYRDKENLSGIFRHVLFVSGVDYEASFSVVYIPEESITKRTEEEDSNWPEKFYQNNPEWEQI